ncbi:glucosamine-6-phosphate deaminase [Citrobacter freundii]|uniref:6-phosphogluconolactonase n=1 Tax=Citrobacter braakii TaxID=57706 RepID=UPI000DF10B14|nr:6-phosphogluconolactonase [Citrobacter braakii]MBJ9241187.1 6-phosphogluconolactonase [Citrobacter braakii]STB68025.1 glucosamine-6-phosphate deaminase [Citrobacter freundii]SUX76050.1 glucosamine-6-phosphate deaminase [Citrobacter freundii]
MKCTAFDNNAALAEQVVSELQALKPHSRVLIPSGSTPRWIYDALAATKIAERLTFFALDEWINVPSESDGSCLSMINQDFVRKCAHPVQLIHFDPYASTEQNIAHYNTALNGEEFDYVILGVGMNGHIGLNEPGVSFDEDYLQTKLDEVTINVASHKYFSGDVTLTEGITVGLNKIIKAGKVIVIINHDAKKTIYQDIVNGDAQHTAIPAIYIKQFPHVNYYITKNLQG